jgi:Fe-S-cluster-containing dehydrogenase component
LNSSTTSEAALNFLRSISMTDFNLNPDNLEWDKIDDYLSTAANAQVPWRGMVDLSWKAERSKTSFPETNTNFSGPAEGPNRREFLGWMAAFSGMMTATVGCTRQPLEKILPYHKMPEETIPGVPLFYATANVLGGFATGTLVESHEGRPTKVEGNPSHPGSLGATDIFAQASILSLYDPDRSKVIRKGNTFSTWGAFLGALRARLEDQKTGKGAGIRIVTEALTSPTFGDQMKSFLAAYPKAQWIQYDPVGRENLRQGLLELMGAPYHPYYDFRAAKVILSLDNNFLFEEPGHVRYARDFAAQRKLVGAEKSIGNRLYVAESTPTISGAMADHRLPVRASELGRFTVALAQAIGLGMEAPVPLEAKAQAWIQAVARDLKRNAGASLILAGESQPPEVHAIVHALNHFLGNVGKTVIYTDALEIGGGTSRPALGQLVTDLKAGQVDTLLILGGNPAYTAPKELEFAKAMGQAKFKAHLSLYDDETSSLCDWHVNQAHDLETWGDARAYDGTVTILQPLIAPLYEGRSLWDFGDALNGRSQNGYEIVRAYWKTQFPGVTFEAQWRRAVHDGVLSGVKIPSRTPTAKPVGPYAAKVMATALSPAPEWELILRPDPTVWDGRFSNNAWLQELPKPLIRLTWDNAALISPAMARQLKLENGDLVELGFHGKKLDAPIWMMPGHPDYSVTLTLGYGRTKAGRLGSRAGFDASVLRGLDHPWGGGGLTVRKTGRHYPLVSTHGHQMTEGRDILRSASLGEYQRDEKLFEKPEPEAKARETTLPLTPEQELRPPDPYQWGMAINLNTCVGCNACVVACQSENNIQTVGKEEVGHQREMHWIRVDAYYRGPVEAPEADFQPVPCMQCEQAPCEVVCPVNATNHSDEGLNDMVYNRCVGTRYCSNNCPYKVRRFNFYQWADETTEILKLGRNPDVTVRSRGVMEKCTYCVQRINAKRIEAKRDNRMIAEGEIKTACQQVCPAESIVFGNIADPNSQVAQIRRDPLNYGMLASELNTRPRTTYVAKLRNKNPELAEMK